MRKTVWVLATMLIALPAFANLSVDLPVVTHVQGATTVFYTSLDVTNNTGASTGVGFEYISSDLSIDAIGSLPTLGPHANFHIDDVLTYLGAQGFLTPGQAAGGFGTMLISFSNPTFTTGKEATATVRVYNFLNPGQTPSVGLAYRAQVLTTNGSHTLTTVVQDTTAGGGAASIVTNLGLEDIGIKDDGTADTTPVTIQLTFYDPATGAQVGQQPTVTLHAGQVTQLNNLWASYGLPTGTHNVVAVATETSGTAQIRGYVSLKDTGTNDGSFFFMQ